MNLAKYALQNRVVMYVFTILLIGGGVWSYQKLSRLEDPEFTIKEALVITEYPGASPRQVEQEVTDKIETAIQQLGQLKKVTSLSRTGLSIITAEMKDKYDKDTLPQIWDELRRKVGDVQSQLPPGVKASVVNDDYSDVFGVFFAVTGKGYSYKELYDFVKMLRRELLLVQDVAKVEIYGRQPETVFVEMSRSRMAELGVSQDDIYQTLHRQNMVVPSGQVQVGSEYIRITPTGMHETVEEIANLLVRAGKSGELIYLKDFAKVYKGYIDPPQILMRFDGQEALGLGISTVLGGNVVAMGEAVTKRLKELEAQAPVGMKLSPVYYQPELVTKAVNGFVISLLEALLIVIVVLMIFMGLRSGLLVGVILLLTIAGTLIFMYIWGISLERISLGALIIALGMLVDNAIVVTEGILIGVQGGMERKKASMLVIAQTAWPLLGATFVAILAFAGIGLSQDKTGEYCYSLFQVILISLALSWVLAVTLTPLFCSMLIKRKPGDQDKDPYAGRVYQSYKKFLLTCLKRRWATCGSLIVLLGLAIYSFGYVDSTFFPDSTLNKFYIDYWLPEGTHVEETSRDLKEIEEYLAGLDEVESVSTFMGQGALRFMLTYTPEKINGSYGQLLVEVKDYRQIKPMIPKVAKYLAANYPNAEPRVNRFMFGPGGGFKIEVRFRGPDYQVLRNLSSKAKAIMEENQNTVYTRDDWRNKVKLLVPVFSEAKARAAGISRPDLADALEMTFKGLTVGLYREEDELLPIISRPPELERLSVDNINDVQIWSPAHQRMIPITQVVSGFKTEWEDSIVHRRNRLPTVTVQCDTKKGSAEATREKLAPRLEAIDLPPGYEMEWGGEYEDTLDGKAALSTVLPFSFLAMILTIILMFNAIRQPLVIFLCVPLAIIGVAFGLLATGQSFGFMALLGFLSLSGMLIKNAVVLIDQIDLEIREGKETFAAIVDSSVSRLRPVAMAAVTTILGMIPLLQDAFFVSMAVTIMAGLAFATALTLIVVPVLYAMFFRARYVDQDSTR
ncbi:efflux RND transporter permease subunit [Thermodesulfobacteriota bacterium]